MPSTAVDSVKSQTNPQCHAASCSDGGCSLSLSSAPTPYALIHVDSPAFRVRNGQWRLPDNHRRCDFLFVGGDDDGGPWVAPVELTTGRRKEVKDFVEQIAGGIIVADELLPAGIRYRFNPVGGCHLRALRGGVGIELRKRSNYVNFRGQRRGIELAECRTRLVDALVNSPA